MEYCTLHPRVPVSDGAMDAPCGVCENEMYAEAQAHELAEDLAFVASYEAATGDALLPAGTVYDEETGSYVASYLVIGGYGITVSRTDAESDIAEALALAAEVRADPTSFHPDTVAAYA